jgi:CRISPR-associated protein Csb2
MALAAAHFLTGEEPAEREALEWIENLPTAPSIVAGEAIARAIVTQYVPVNDKAGPSKTLLQSIPLTRDRQPRSFARAFLDSDTVYLSWPEIDPPEAVRRALESLSAKVTRIGHSSSLVQMWLATANEVGEANWVPDDDRAELYLRVATPRTLDDLERRYHREAVESWAGLRVAAADAVDKKAQRVARKRLKEEFRDGPPTQLRPDLSRYQGYARPVPPPDEARGTVFSPHLTVLTLEREEGPYRHLDLFCVLQVVQRWREAILSHSNDRSAHVLRVLSGHDANRAALEEPHLAFVPLAFVGHPHADGRLLGVGLALPQALPRDDRRDALRAAGRVRRLVLGRLGAWTVTPQTAVRPAWNLCSEAWTAHPEGATRWSTVTPIVFDRHPKSNDRAAQQREVASMIARACVHIGLPEPREVIVTSVSAHLGTPPAHAFPRLRRKDGSERRHTHAILAFDQCVRGPILIGAGRYRGYGACRPLDSPKPQP